MEAQSKTCVIYARYSPRPINATDKSESCETQIEYCVRYAELHGLEVLAIHRDDGISGKDTEDRPGYLAAVEQACRRKSMLLAYSLSRLSRNINDALLLGHKIDAAGANLATVKDHIDTSCAIGRFFFAVMAALATMERELTSERTSDAMRAHQDRGRRMTREGFTRFGQQVDPADKSRLIPEPWEQAVVERVYEEARKGKGPGKIARSLNNDGVPARGAKWYSSSIIRMLARGRREGGEVVISSPQTPAAPRAFLNQRRR